MKPANLNRKRTFLAGQPQLNRNSRVATRDFSKRLANSLLDAWVRRPALIAIIASAVLAVGLFVVRAADQTWGANGNSAWYTNTNWAGGAFPGLQGAAASNTDSATWTSAATGTTFGINMGTASLNLGAIVIDSTRSTATNIGNSSVTGGSLRLYGKTVNAVPNVIVRHNGTGLLTLQIVQSGNMAVVLSNATDNIINIDNTGGVTISSAMSGSGMKLTKAGGGAGTLTLSGANTYSGDTTISTGKLALTAGGSIVNSPNIIVAGGATFDVSGLTTAFTTSTQTLKASGNGSTGTIATTTSKGLSLTSTAGLQFTAYNGSTAPLTVTGASSITLASTNAAVVTVPGSALAAGDYKLIAIGSGNTTAVNGTAPSSVTVNGAGGLAAGTTASLVITGGELFLHVVNAATGSMVTTLPGQTFTSGSGNSGSVTAQTAGTPFNLTLTATLADGVTKDTSYSGTKTINYSGPGGSPTYTTSVNFTSGQATGVSTTLTLAQTTTITASDGTLTGIASSSLLVNPGAINSYVVTATSPQVVGVSFNTTVTAKDANNNTVTTDSTTVVTMTSASGNMQFDSNGDTTFGDNTKTLSSGTFTISTKDNVAETTTITATDANTKTGTSGSIVVGITPKYRSRQSGNWNDFNTWEVDTTGGGFVNATAGQTPTSADDTIEIQGTHTVTITASVSVDQVTVDVGGQITINSGVVLTVANGSLTDLTINGTVLNSGTLTISASATWAINSAATYIHNTTSSSSTLLGTNPTISNTSNWIYRGSSSLAPSISISARTYGNLLIESTSGLLTLTSNSGGNALTINGAFSVGATGAGTVSYNTNGFTGAINVASGVTIGAGSTLTLGSSTLTLSGGNWTDSGTFAAGTSVIAFAGAGTQTIVRPGGGLETFSSLAVNKSSGNLTLGADPNLTNVTVSGTSGNVLQLLNGGIDLNDPDNGLTLSGNGGNVLVSGGVRTISGPIGSTVALTGSKTVTSASGGTLVIDQPIVVLQASVDFGSALTTINTELRLSTAAAAVNTNPPTYGANSLLQYGCACSFGRGAEWSATSGPGYPAQVTLSFGASLDLGANSGQATGRSVAGRLYIFDGTLTMNNGGNAMTAPLTVGGPLQIEAPGSLILSSLVGGNLNVAGNFTDNGTFTHNNRVTTLNGAATQTISGTAASIQFGDLVAAGPDTQLANDIIVNGNLGLTGGNITTNSSTIIMPAGATSSGAFDVVGNLRRTGFVTGGAALSFGNPFTSIKVDSGTAPTDVLINLVLNAPDGDGFGFTTAVQRTYTITPTGGSGYSTTLRLHYLDTELNGNDETSASFDLWRYNGTNGWSRQVKTGNSTSDNWVEKSGVTQFSPWTIGGSAAGGPSPSAVKLTKFNAASFTDGVQLTWESGFEVNNLGYRLYREQNGKRTRVTPSIVAGSTLLVGQGNRMTAGYSYSWFDPQGTPGTAYYLEALDLDSSRQTYGPVYPYGGSRNGVSPKRERALLLNELGKSLANNSGSADTTGWPASMSAAARSESLKLKPQTLAAQQAIAGGKAVKLQVRQTGWYRVTQPELVAAGFDPASDARLLQLYVDGEEVPVRLSGEGARLNANDTLEFYGVALDTQTTDTRTYWLVNGTSAGKRISAKRGKIKPGDQNWTDSPGLRSFAFTAERREKLIYSPRLLNGDGENIFGALIFSDPTEQTLPVKNFDREAATPVQLEVALQGLTAQGHEVHIMLNGADLGSMTFAASAHSTATFAVNRALLHEGDNTVSLASANGDSDISFVDYVRLTYAHQYTADNNALRFSVPGGGVVRVDGFSTANIRVVDITDPNSPLELATAGSPAGTGYSIKVQALGNDTRTLIAFADDLPAHPASITANQPSNWNASTNGADLVIITHKDFRQAIEPLATLRRNQGLSVAVVDVEDVYDEFSYGAHTPAAIKAFLMNAAGTWARKPGYLLLVGDSSWDPRNFMDQGANDFVPTKLIDTNYMETASDDWLVDFTGEGNAAMALGRLPGRTAAEVSLMVSKIMAYEQERELNVPLRGAVMVADSGFEKQSAQTSALLPAGVSKQSIDRAAIGNDDLMRGQLLDALNQGPMIVNFYGHGSVGVWTAASVLDSDLADTLTNNNRSSIYLMMTCLNGYAHDAYIDSLSESLLKAPNGGAVAVWASSGFTAPEPQFAMDSQFYRLLFGAQPLRLGEAARQAKLATSDLDVRRTWNLLGDPTMRVR